MTGQCFSEIALPLVDLGIKVIPVQPSDKRCLLPGWQKKATTDAEQIKRWNAENPNYNVGCVGTPDTVVVLDCDIHGLIRRIEQETGRSFPKTLIVRSAGKGCAHLYFRQTDVSRSLGNKKAAGLFDLQSVDKYVVGPRSRLDNGRSYDIVQDAPIADFPDWLETWILANADADKPKPKTHGDHPVNDDFDIADMLEHYGLDYVQDGEWFITDICPVSGHKHEQSTRTGFFFDGNSFGFHCFASGCDGSSMTVGQVIKHLNQDHDPYPATIWPEEDIADLLMEFGIDGDQPMIREGECKLCHRTESEGCVCGKFTSIKDEPTPIKKKQSAPDCSTVIPTPAENKNGDTEEIIPIGYRHERVVSVAVVTMSQVVPHKLDWLWDQRILKNYITFFAGLPERGKSLATMDIVAVVTTGRDWPDGAKNTLGPKNVLLLVSEDGLDDVIWPRLVAAKADLCRVKALKSVITEDDKKKKKRRTMAFNEDVSVLRGLIKRIPDLALVIVDPITSYYGCDANKSREIKPILDKLKELCDETGVAMLAVAHFSKRTDVGPLQQIAGDVSIGGTARTVWTFSEDPDKENEYLMTCAKGNHSRDKSGLRFTPEEVVVALPNGDKEPTPRMNWLGKTTLRAQDVMDKQKENAKTGKNDKQSEAARAFLRVRFTEATGHRCKELYAEAEKEGITVPTLKRARYQLVESGELNILVDDRRNKGDGYWWMLSAAAKTMDDTDVL